jgi:hypothetical protein
MTATQLDTTTILKVTEEHISSKLGDGMVMLGLKSGFYYSLNQCGAKIWELLQVPRQVGEIVAALENLYEVDSTRLLQDVLLVLRDMLGRGLVEIVPGHPEER